MTSTSEPRTWASWRAHLQAKGLLRVQAESARKQRAREWSPLISIELLDDYEFFVEWSEQFDMPTARCVQVPFACWPHPTSADEAVAGLYQYLVSVFVSLGADLSLVPGIRELSDATEQRAYQIQREAREEFLATLANDIAKPEA